MHVNINWAACLLKVTTQGMLVSWVQKLDEKLKRKSCKMKNSGLMEVNIQHGQLFNGADHSENVHLALLIIK